MFQYFLIRIRVPNERYQNFNFRFQIKKKIRGYSLTLSLWDINPTRPTGERDQDVVKQVNSSALHDRADFPNSKIS